MTKLCITTGFLTILLAATLTACQKPGPAAQAGKKVDEAIDNAGQQIEKAGEKNPGHGKRRQVIACSSTLAFRYIG